MSGANAVRELREQTGAGVLDCRKALDAAKGDLGQAREILKKQGHERAAKRAERSARQGLIGLAVDPSGTSGVLVELLCETDFVARTAPFRDFLKQCVATAALRKIETRDALLAEKEGGQTLKDRLDGMISQIGENIVLAAAGRMAVSAPGQKIGGYLHLGGQVGTLVQVEAPQNNVADSVLKDILLHITAMQPTYVRREEAPSEKLAALKEAFLKEAAQSGKPQAIVEKIVQGKIDKWLSEVCLVDQPFVRDPSGKTHFADFLKEAAPGAAVLKFIRLQVGGTPAS